MRQDDRTHEFELLAVPHLEVVHNLAAWLTGNVADAEDVVQEVYLRAFRYFDRYEGNNVRVWLLTIVRNSFITWAKGNHSGRLVLHGDMLIRLIAASGDTVWGSVPGDPEALLIQRTDNEALRRLMQRLPAEYRQVLMLREVEDLAYKDIAEIIRVPIGTVMSRLSRARLALRKLWLQEGQAGGRFESPVSSANLCR
jgi:RNA polymerase sigma-70 factor, ECF subfamily